MQAPNTNSTKATSTNKEKQQGQNKTDIEGTASTDEVPHASAKTQTQPKQQATNKEKQQGTRHKTWVCKEERSCWRMLASNPPQKKYCYGWLHRSFLRRYRPQSAVSCSTLWERAAGSSPSTSQASLKFIGSRTLQMKNLLAMSVWGKANTQTKSKSS